MSSGINQTINAEQQNSKTVPKRVEAQIATANHAKARHNVAKDTVVPSAGDVQTKSPAKGKDSKPTLQIPKGSFKGLKGKDGDQGAYESRNLISIIGEVMTLQAKSNSNFWSTLWKQASQSMQMEVKFAPIIGQAVNDSYQAQSKATLADAHMSSDQGWIALGMFGTSVVAGGVTAYGADVEADPDVVARDEAVKPFMDGGMDRDEADAALSNQDPSWKDRGMRTTGWFNAQREKVIAKFSKGFNTTYTTSQIAGQLGNSLQGLFVDSHFKAIMAHHQAEQGQAQAIDKQAEQYAQFFGQAFNRSDQMASGTQQNLDYAMNILKSTADSLTQTVNGMFRG